MGVAFSFGDTQHIELFDQITEGDSTIFFNTCNGNCLMECHDFHFHVCTLRTLERQTVMVGFFWLKSSKVHFRPAFWTIRITNDQVP